MLRYEVLHPSVSELRRLSSYQWHKLKFQVSHTRCRKHGRLGWTNFDITQPSPLNMPSNNWEHLGDHNHPDFPQSTAIQMGGVLQYKLEMHCDTDGRSTDNISLFSERRGTKSAAIQVIGSALRYKLEVYCDTSLRSSGGWGF